MRRENIKGCYKNIPEQLALSRHKAGELVNGEICFDDMSAGLQVHVTNAKEKFSTAKSIWLADAFSVVILFKGQLNFSLNDNHYSISPAVPAKCFCHFSTPDIRFSRQFTQDQHVLKVNVQVTKEWLEQRCISSLDTQKIHTLFSNPGKVLYLKPQHTLLAASHSLLNLVKVENIQQQIQKEQIATEIISLSVEQLLSQVSTTESELTEYPLNSSVSEFTLLLDKLLYQDISLKEVAEKMGMSVSTLQRKVKSSYKVTAIEYRRIKKLELAKEQLINNKLSIGEIAFNAGYQHSANFITAFKKQFKTTPAMIRQQTNTAQRIE